MGWAHDAYTHLRQGQPAVVRPLGGSMRGRIESGQKVTIVPLGDQPLAIGDAVFVRWKGGFLLHLVKDLRADQVLIGNNVGKINGWVHQRDVVGRVLSVED